MGQCRAVLRVTPIKDVKTIYRLCLCKEPGAAVEALDHGSDG